MALREIMISGFGEGVTVATIVKWHVKSSDTVLEGQVLAEVMAGQTTVTVSSPKTGRILVTHGGETEQVKVNQPLVTMEVPTELAPAALAASKSGTTSRSLRPGMSGATLMLTSMPASAARRIVSRRRGGVGA